MNLDEFLYYLHYESYKVSPSNWVVNWEDAPLPYKLYQGLPVIPLPSDVPQSLDGIKTDSNPCLKEIGHFLWYTFGLTQMNQQLSLAEPIEMPPFYRRFIPSGGGLYPTELYIYLKIEEVPEGIYHYDAAHHQLILLRAGNFDSYLFKALGSRCEFSSSFATVFISTFFWKNFFKYHNFSYRLQGLDAGFVIGQLLKVSEEFGFETGVYYHFLDKAVNHLLGLSEQEESVYAVIPLSVDSRMRWFPPSADELCKELPTLEHQHYVRSKEIKEFPMLLKMNKASMNDSFASPLQIEDRKEDEIDSQTFSLPDVSGFSYDLGSACRKRYSPGMDFVLKQVKQEDLAALLMEAFSGFCYRNDIDKHPFRLTLHGCFYNVAGLPNGAYDYDLSIHAVKTIQKGDFRAHLQHSLFGDFVNMSQIPLSLFIGGDDDHYQKTFGYRGHRIQHMEAGILSQHLLLAASALNMGGHPILGFDVNSSDQLLKVREKGKTSLLQIPIGHIRPNPRLQGSLHT